MPLIVSQYVMLCSKCVYVGLGWLVESPVLWLKKTRIA